MLFFDSSRFTICRYDIYAPLQVPQLHGLNGHCESKENGICHSAYEFNVKKIIENLINKYI